MRIPNPRLSRRGYVALTIAGILVPTLFLGVLGLHLVQRHFRFQNQILEEYGRFSVEYAASEIQRAIVTEERDIASYLQLVALVTGFKPEDELRRAEWTYPLIEHAFAREMDGSLVFAKQDPLPDNASVAARARRAHADSTRSRAMEITRRTLDNRTVEHVLLSNEVHFYAGEDAGSAYQLVAFPYRDAMNMERGVMGFFLNVEHLRRDLVGRLLETSIHAAEGRFAPDFGKTLTLVGRDERGHEVYTHHHSGVLRKHGKAGCAKRDLSRSGLDDLLPGWTVGITYRDPKGFAWMRRIMTLQVGLLVFAVALAVAGTLVAMRFALRQMELSRIKSHLVSNITHEIKT